MPTAAAGASRTSAAGGSTGGLDPILTTKVYNPVTGDPADRGLAVSGSGAVVVGSLERLGVDRIDLYLAHDRDRDTPLAETVAAFEELRARGRSGPGASRTTTQRRSARRSATGGRL